MPELGTEPSPETCDPRHEDFPVTAALELLESAFAKIGGSRQRRAAKLKGASAELRPFAAILNHELCCVTVNPQVTYSVRTKSTSEAMRVVQVGSERKDLLDPA